MRSAKFEASPCFSRDPAQPPAALPDPLWVFAYGSLIWNPGFPFAERRVARLHGFHRRFCIQSVHYRGTPDAPGLVLGLDFGGSCRGVVYRVRADEQATALAYLWQRELITDVYEPRMLSAQTREGAVRALCFVVNRGHAHYIADRCPDRTARIIGTAHGPTGSNRDYLRETAEHLDAHGIPDRSLGDLLRRVGLGRR